MIIHALTAPPEAAFDAWLNPFVMNLWMASEPEHEIVAIELRPRTGGDFTIVERTGARDIRVCGRFDAVVPTSHIALTLNDASGIAVDIIACETGCELQATTRGTPERWRAMLDRLARLLG